MAQQSELACPAVVDNDFGPWAGPNCRGGFDFTLKFEEAILCLPLQCIFLAVLPLRIWQLSRADVKVQAGYLQPIKAVISITLVACTAALLGIWATTSNSTIVHTPLTVPTATMVFVSSVGIFLLSWLEHQRSFRPSLLVSAYLFLFIITDMARTRTLWMIGTNRLIPSLHTVCIALRVLQLVVESVEKRILLIERYANTPREGTRTILSNTVFWWLNSLFLTGYKKNLCLDDLIPLEYSLGARQLYGPMTTAWENVPDKTVPGVLFITWLRVFARPVLACVPARLLQIGFTYAQPFLIARAIEFAILPQGQPFDNTGYGLIGAFAIVYIGWAISFGQYSWRVRRVCTTLRGSIISLIYAESLKLDSCALDTDATAALTLVGTDTETLMEVMFQFHDVWGSLVEIIIAIYLVYRELGAACAMPLGVTVVTLVGTICLALPSGPAQAAWIQATQVRVTATTKTLGNIKGLKISALTEVAFQILRNLREQELKTSMKFRLLLGGSMVLLISATIWSPILTFCLYAGLSVNGQVSATISTVFTAYSVLYLLSGPLTAVVLALPTIAAGLASFQRVQDHLNRRKRIDNRRLSWQIKEAGATGPGEKPSDQSIVFLDSKDGATDTTNTSIHSGKQSARPAGLGPHIIASIQGSHTWKGGVDPVIEIPEWEIQRDQLTVVFGPVGCGKSTLLKVLLGELSDFKGSIRTEYSRVAYCGQVPWVTNAKVRDIIIGGDRVDQAWYDSVIRACALEQDLQDWPDGEDTIAGSSGVSMSGGQKQRLALARALYSRTELLILDDVLTGLDATTMSTVCERLWGEKGLLRVGHVTTVLASSGDHVAKYARSIYVLSDKGRLSRSEGTDDVLKILQVPTARSSKADEKSEVTLPLNSTNLPASLRVTSHIQEEEDLSRRFGDWGMYKVYANAAGKRTLLIFALSMVVYAFCGSFPTIWLGWWATSPDPSADLGKWLGVYVAFGVGSMLAAGLGIWLLIITVINRCGIHFHHCLADTVSQAPMSFHYSVDNGITINRFSEDLRLIDMELPAAGFGAATALALALANFIIASVSSRYMAAIFPILVVTLYAIQHFYLRTSRQLRLLDIEYKAAINSHVIETLNGLLTIRAQGWEDRFLDKAFIVLDDSQRPSYLLTCIQCWLSYSIDMVVALVAVIFIVITTTLREQIGPRYMGIGLNTILGLSGSAKTLVTFWIMMEVALGAVMRIKGFTAKTEREITPDDDTRGTNSESWPRGGSIQIQAASASYGSKVALSKVSLDIEPGHKVAICGRTGSGKSSLTLSLLRLIDLDAGSIVIDGVDISKLPHEFVRSQIVAVPQEVCLLDGSIRFNLDPSGNASESDMVDALQKVNLWEKLAPRGGMDAIVDEKFFSKGEAQLFVFARAMLRKPTILILDEFISSLDAATGKVIEDLLWSWCAGCTVIAVTHKLDSILNFDKVAVLRDGAVLEYDKPQLLVKQDSAFKGLYRAFQNDAHES